MKLPLSRKILAGIGAVLAFVGYGLAYYMMTVTHEETVFFITTEVFTYERDAIITPVAIGVIGVVLLLMAALTED